jgi:hypothetical protein
MKRTDDNYPAAPQRGSGFSKPRLSPQHEIENGAVVEDKIAASAVTNGKLANDAVTWNKILSGNVITASLADSAVTSAKILDAAVSRSKIANAAIDENLLDTGAVSVDKIQAGAVTFPKLATAAVRPRNMWAAGAAVVPLNGSFEDYDSVTTEPFAWSFTGDCDFDEAAEIDDTVARSGQVSIRFKDATGSSSGGRTLTSDPFPARRNASGEVTLRLSLKPSSANYVNVTLSEYEADGTPVTSTTQNIDIGVEFVGTEWKEFAFTVALDPATSQLDVSFDDDGDPAAEFYIDDIEVTR